VKCSHSSHHPIGCELVNTSKLSETVKGEKRMPTGFDKRWTIRRVRYTGRDERRLAKVRKDSDLCLLIEVELRKQYAALKPGEIKQVLYTDMAASLDRWEDQEAIRQVMCRINGGSNGVTFGKPE
jgi:predicted chitinase